VTAGWFLLSLLLPPIAAGLAAAAFRDAAPGAIPAIVLNAVAPGAGLAALGRPTLEVVLGVMFAQASLLITGGMANIGFLLPVAGVGALWASCHTPFNPIAVAARNRPAARGEGGLTRQMAPTTERPEPNEIGSQDTGYAVAVRCTECGADVEVPVLSHMAGCTFCGSSHLVVGHGETLFVTLPERVRDDGALTEAVLDHYRYRHYLELYRRTVAPLEARTTEMSEDSALIGRSDVEAAVAAAEAAASRRADAYRRKLADQLEVRPGLRFLAPYRHGVGTLFQAAFGRRKPGMDKDLQFAIRTIEAATLATTGADLPPMGKLSYLRALRPAALCDPDVRTLPLDTEAEDLRRAFGELDRKRLVRDMDVIRLGVQFRQEVSAVVWRPWWIAEADGPGIDESLLVDCAAATVSGVAPDVDRTRLEPLPESARQPGIGLRFVPMECPTCGHEYPFDVDAVLHFCTNCHRVCRIDGRRKHQVSYRHESEIGDGDLAPFWCFELAIRSSTGELATDLMHLKDGIDGSLDQIGDDAVAGRHLMLAPAFRCINSRLMASAYERVLLHTLRRPPRLEEGRFPLTRSPNPWSVSLDEEEARLLLPLYLAHVYGRRDLARVKVDQVQSWVFDAVQEAPGSLVYVSLPRSVTEPFRAYVGRYRSRAVRAARTARA
jgi:Zn finger protein HypA/HybF involved in hydrogenase expression